MSIATILGIEKLGVFKWVAFVLCALLLVQGQLRTVLAEVERFGHLADFVRSEWVGTNFWLEAAECTRLRGVWLAMCEGDRLVPFSERSIGDDPGHALILSIWSRLGDRVMSLTDIARLNIALNTLGLVMLASLLFALRVYVASIVLLALGPVEYLGWMGLSPHWSFIGVVSMAAILPIALVAREEGLLPGWSGLAFVAVGFASLALAALVREAIGIMAFLVSLGAVGTVAWRRLRARRSLLGPILVAASVVAAAAAAQWVVVARDAAFAMEPAVHRPTHGLSHTLYIGLGFVPNRFGIRYEDEFAATAVKKIAPDALYCSPEYFRVLWTLYIDHVLGDPGEVARIYLEKAKLLFAARTIQPGPTIGLALAIAAAHLFFAALLGLWGRIGLRQGVIVETVALAFAGFFVVQSILALPEQLYVLPVNAFLLVLFGVILEFICRSTWRVLAWHASW